MPPPHRNRKDAAASLAPLESLALGAWIALVVTAWSISPGPFLRHETGVAEALLGAFVVLLVLRRRERGVGLFLPFVTLTLAVLTGAVLTPELLRLAARQMSDRLDLVHDVCGAVDLAKVALLVLTFYWSFLRR